MVLSMTFRTIATGLVSNTCTACNLLLFLNASVNALSELPIQRETVSSQIANSAMRGSFPSFTGCEYSSLFDQNIKDILEKPFEFIFKVCLTPYLQHN